MESILLSVISSYLKDYVNNFRKEQISLNFLRGHGVIKDLDINVDAINDTIFQSGAPALRFTRIIINTLSIDCPFMSLKTKPIVAHIDEIFIEIAEIVDIPHAEKKPIPPKKSAKYGYLDRVLDSISFQVNKVWVAFRTLGRLKTNEIGIWTPPVLLVEMTGNRYFSTNHNGIEVELEECFRILLTKRPILFIYKKFLCKKLSVYLVNPDVWFNIADELTNGKEHKNFFQKLNVSKLPMTRGYIYYNLIKNLIFEINISLRKRQDNNFLLGLEIAITINNIIINLGQKIFTELIHLIIGISYALSRKDVIKEIYGENPYNEPQIYNQTSTFHSNTTSTSTSTSTTSNNNNINIENDNFTSILPMKINSSKTIQEQYEYNETINHENYATSTAIYESTQTINATSTTGYNLESSISLDSDIDPIHFRLAIIIEIYDAYITLSYNETTNSTSKTSSKHKSTKNSMYRGANIHINGLIISIIWPEYSLITEGIQQIILKSLLINEFIGVRKITLLRTINYLDDNNRPLCFDIITRNIKETNNNDYELQSNISLIMKRKNYFPSPPITKNLASNIIEIQLTCIELVCNLDSWYNFLYYLINSWDDRWITGEWILENNNNQNINNESNKTIINEFINTNESIKTNETNESHAIFETSVKSERIAARRVSGRLEELVSPGSAETYIIMNGIKILIYPDFIENPISNIHNSSNNSTQNHSNTNNNDSILPAQIIINIGLSNLIWKSSLILKHNTNWNYTYNTTSTSTSTSTSDSMKDNEMFPCNNNDLSLLLKKLKPIIGINLLSDRFELLLTEITFKVITDSTSTSTDTSKPMNSIDLEHPIIKPFTICYQSSIDPHPNKTITKLPNIETFYNPYLRQYYWLSNNSDTIKSINLSIDDIIIECTALEITRLTHVIELINNWINSMAVTSNNQTNEINETNKNQTNESNNNTTINTNDLMDMDMDNGYCSTIVIIELKKFDLLLLNENTYNNKQSFNSNPNYTSKSTLLTNTPTARNDVILSMTLQSINTIFEWLNDYPSVSSKNLLIKGKIGSISIYGNNLPIVIIINDELQSIINNNNNNQNKSNINNNSNNNNIIEKKDSFYFRYEANTNEKYSSVDVCKNANNATNNATTDSMTDIATNIETNNENNEKETIITSDGLWITQSKTIIKYNNNNKLTIKLLNNTKIILSLQNIDNLLENIFQILLSGAGIICYNSNEWLDNSILGYMIRIYYNIINGSIDTNNSNVKHNISLKNKSSNVSMNNLNEKLNENENNSEENSGKYS